MTAIDPSPILACAAAWRPRPGWATTIRAPYEALTAGATGLAAIAAWNEIAMMTGDTHAAPLCLVVCLRAEQELPPGYEDRRLGGHRDLAMLDLGLTRTTAPGPIRLRDLGSPGIVDDHPGELAAWLARALAPFAGDLTRAADFTLRLAAVRTGIVEGPEPDP